MVEIGSDPPGKGSPSTVFTKDTTESTCYDCEAAACTLVSKKRSLNQLLSLESDISCSPKPRVMENMVICKR